MFFQSEFSFDSILVIESLEENHKTARKLAFDDLRVYGNTKNKPVTYCSISSVAEFEKIISDLVNDLTYGFNRVLSASCNKPIIHIEAHGSKHGIELIGEGEIYPWSEFIDQCRKINRLTLNNLLVVLPICEGFNSIRNVAINDLTPFWGLIGSELTINNTLEQFSAFYRLLFESDDLMDAFKQLDSRFSLYLCEQIFINVFLDYYTRHCVGSGKRERLEKLVTKFREKNPTDNFNQARKLFRSSLQDFESSFEKFKNRFLLADLQANSNRFNFDSEIIVDYAQKYFISNGA